MTTTLNENKIVKSYPHASEHSHIALGQIHHRIELVKFWDIRLGERVLEIGCGQGDCTVVLASAVGEEGHVTAIDPAPLDYGSPFTLGQAHDFISASPLGRRIDFVQADPATFLTSSDHSLEKYSVAVIAHCIWYFSSPSVLDQLLTSLAKSVQRICIAEYALTASDPKSIPHVLATLTQASVECHKPISKSNIRTVLSPSSIKASALAASLTLEKETKITPNEGMFDGRWECGAVLRKGYRDEIDENVTDEREKAVILAMQDSVRSNLELLTAKGENVRTMDVWMAVFSKGTI